MTNRNGVPEMEQEDVRTESGVSPEESAESSGTEAGTENAEAMKMLKTARIPKMTVLTAKRRGGGKKCRRC